MAVLTALTAHFTFLSWQVSVYGRSARMRADCMVEWQAAQFLCALHRSVGCIHPYVAGLDFRLVEVASCPSLTSWAHTSLLAWRLERLPGG